MALINCPECNKEISDKSDKCIHCGYPLQTNTVSQDEKYSIRVLLNKEAVKTIKLIRECTGLGLKEAKDLYDSAPVTIAKDLSKDEATRIAQPFYDNLINIEICKDNNDIVNLGLKPQPPQNKYYSNEPLHSYTSNSINTNQPKCPTCNSTNIKKISLTKKAVGGAMFGIFSSSVRKTYECKNCGYKW